VGAETDLFLLVSPCCRGGLIFWADLIGAQKIVARLDQLAGQFRAAGLAGFFEPCDYLRQAAASGRKLSAGPSAAASKL
jgi:enoyl-CoA hydratase/3-hydroxyacyl-CoA dehydrogenase